MMLHIHWPIGRRVGGSGAHQEIRLANPASTRIGRQSAGDDQGRALSNSVDGRRFALRWRITGDHDEVGIRHL